ncbi:toxin-antitoxin system TumE family protein [Desulfobacula sp.]
MLGRVDLSKIIDHLKSLEIVSSTQVIFLDESLQRSICKLRCSLLPSRYKLDVRLIQTEKEIIYSYQLFHDRPIIRWDNAPHFPSITTFPHHFHNQNNKIKTSNLMGNIIEDIDYVIGEIRRLLTEGDL